MIRETGARIAGGLIRRFHAYVVDVRYDRAYGVDTNGVLLLHQLTVTRGDVSQGSEYAPVPRMSFWRALSAVEDDLSRFTFVDFGSGKGRTLLLASEYPFRRVIGVEFARELHEAAARNVQVFASPRRRCADVEAVCMDAAEYPTPEGPCIFFLYNPFRAPVMSRVIANIERSWRAAPRDMYFLYMNPKQRHVLDAPGFIAEQRRGVAARAVDRLVCPEPLVVYRTLAAGGAH